MPKNLKSHPQRGSRSRHRGSALVEFALVSSLFLFLLLGIIQYGIYINATSAIVNMTRDGARFSSVTPASDATTDAQQVHDRMVSPNIMPPQLSASAVPVSSVSVAYFNPSGASASRTIGNSVTVTVSYDMSSKIFMPRAFIGTFLPKVYKSVSSFRIELN